MVAILAVLTILGALAIDSVVLARSSRRASAVARPIPIGLPDPPRGLFVSRGHTWLRIADDGLLRVGIDELLSGALGTVDAVELPPPGTNLEKGDTLATLRVGRRTLGIPSPAAGRVLGGNGAALRDPRRISADPYGSWLVSLAARDPLAALTPLSIGEQAVAFLRRELDRLADFLTPAETPERVPVMADGGVPARGAAVRLDDAGWRAFGEAFVRPEEDRQ